MPHFFENRQEYRSVYILLTRSDTYFSRLIHLLTDEDYTHVSICLDADLQHFTASDEKAISLCFLPVLYRKPYKTAFSAASIKCPALYTNYKCH